MFKEFKKFALRGNVIDLAVGIVVGGAFGKIVSSFVTDILMPPLAIILGKVNFTNQYINLSGGDYDTLEKAKAAGAITLNYGNFLNVVIDFLIVAGAIFLVVRWMNKLMPKKEVESKTKDCRYCLSKVPKAATRCPFCTSTIK